YYYYLYHDLAKAQDYAQKYLDPTVSDPDPQNDYLRIQVLWAQKKYDEAISGAKALISAAGEQTKPRVYKLLADSYLSKGDTASARQNVDLYFAKSNEEDLIPLDYMLKASVYSGTGGDDNIVFDSYAKAAKLDSLTKAETYQKAVDFFERNKK